MTELRSRAHTKAMTPSNIQADFRITEALKADKFYPAEVRFREARPIQKVQALKKGKEELKSFFFFY